MTSPKSLSDNKVGIWANIRPLLVLSPQKRPFGIHLTVALSVGIPALIAVWLNHFALGVMASLGGLASLYIRQTPLPHRMVTMALVTFGFSASFTLSLLAGFNPWVLVLALFFVSFLATFICRFFVVPPPGSFFFIMIACVASAVHFDLSLVAQRAGLLLFGCFGASLLALIYSLVQLMAGNKYGLVAAEPTEPRVAAIFLEAATIASFIAISYLLALWFGFDKPYWVPISCLAILQGASFRTVWQRKVHRIVGTAIGMGLAWVIFSFSPNAWTLALLIMGLSFLTEVLVTRNYGLAVIFITPLTIILAEASSVAQDLNWLLMLRMKDVILGSVVGYIGGWFLHQPRLYIYIEQRLLRLLSK
ncbi:FUSC family protein [Rheinheimera sp. MMS21-TC3]|uniref:FUSC family protein n=1 Tax=Rheinheimera sp. MMS21-TC3 TaxID=3072790 RepID=UPI0028C4203F|nr:FUSC family protein [Rheinheimera sp. MMS21-TC3]WNO61731.1 FUSC family protein [Rheinheimera sp. MMS21-TC3]